MPLWLRKFTYHKIKEHYDKQSKAIKDSKAKSSNTQSLVGSDGKVKSPASPKKATYK